MRVLEGIFLALLFATSVSGQVTIRPTTPPPQPTITREQVIQSVCHAPEIKQGAEFQEMQRIEARLGTVVNRDQKHHISIALVNSNIVNAWDHNFNLTNSLICVPVMMTHFMGGAEGELAFIVSHEIGHAVDDQCKTQAGRAQVGQTAAPVSSFLGSLFNGGKGAVAATRLATQRSCEARADEIGFVIFTESGYNPYDAAGAFGRLEMYMGDTSTGVLARLTAMGTDHPMTPDRIKHMRALLINHEAQIVGRSR